ncbi:PIG-L deacetylase family protein [Ekhidna sp.]
MLELLKNKKVLVAVAHPDDELLGIGGTLNKLATEYNSHIHVVILGEGITSRDDKRDTQNRSGELTTHNKNILEAQKIIGYQSLSTYDFPDNRFDSVDLLDVVKVIEKEKAAFQPDVIITHHHGDLNVDHRITFQAVLTATRPMELEKVSGIITFETPSGTEWQSTADSRIFRPNLYLSISEEQLKAKIAAMECYEYEKRAFPHPRSPKALRLLAEYRGMTIGKPLAEAFQIVRWID